MTAIVMTSSFTACQTRQLTAAEAYDIIISSGEWAVMEPVTDEYILKTRFLIDDPAGYDELIVMECPASAVVSEIILIRDEDTAAAEELLERRRAKAIEKDSLYPEDRKIAESSVVGTVGQLAYFIMGEYAREGEEALLSKR